MNRVRHEPPGLACGPRDDSGDAVADPRTWTASLDDAPQRVGRAGRGDAIHQMGSQCLRV